MPVASIKGNTPLIALMTGLRLWTVLTTSICMTNQHKRERERERDIAWLNIANAYGSIHHSLIQFPLTHYHAPSEFCRLIQSMYAGLSATISSDAPVPLEIGVYQGDPLSVAIFLAVINTLSDTLCTRRDLGFTLPSSSVTINHLLYADDACVRLLIEWSTVSF